MNTQVPSPSAPNRLVRSLAFRSAVFYKAALQIIGTSRSPKPATDDFVAVSMTDRKHALMCEQMMASMRRTWASLPVFRLLVDHRRGPVDIDRLRRSYGGRVETVEWDAIARQHQNRPELVQFAEGNLLGRKLALIMAEAEKQKTLWIDNDILFFHDFLPLVVDQAKGLFIGATRDSAFGGPNHFASYAPLLAQHLFGNDTNTPSVNSGLTLASGAVYDSLQLASLVKHTLETREQSYFTEQTVIGWAALHSRGILWDNELVRLDDSDLYRLGPSPTNGTWKARHYTGNIRHLFWRDAFFLRFGKSN